MIRNSVVRYAAAAAFVAVFGTSSPAFAADEVEPNDPIASAQPLVFSGDRAEVTAVLGVLSGTATPDLDFYAFEASPGDVVTIDIDGGAKLPGSGERSVDTVVALFGPGPEHPVLAQVDDGAGAPDEGSLNMLDSRIDGFRLDDGGTYIVGVSSFPRKFVDGGQLITTRLGGMPNGGYRLIVSGVTPLMEHISIEVKPGSRKIAPINAKSKGNIPVALISSETFNALEVDRDSVTFGVLGTEESRRSCAKQGRDVNGDGQLDLVCFFHTEKTGFAPGHDMGVVMGTINGRPFDGRGLLKVLPVPVKAERR